MKAVIGLGNVGEKYAFTRHNVGFLVAEELANFYKLQFSNLGKLHAQVAKSEELIIAKPTTMMNASGSAALAIINFYKIALNNLYVVHDDLDIRLGEYKIQLGRGPKVHNGVNSVEESLGFSDFFRIRVGVDNREPANRVPGEKYALDKFPPDELGRIRIVVEKIVQELQGKL